MEIVLASQSPYRRAQLESFALHFVAVKPEVNEDELKELGPKNLEELTRFLAHQKAASLRARFPDAVLIGSDQLAESEGQRLDKPMTRARAKEQLHLLQGKTHRLITSLCVLSPDATFTTTDVAQITLRKLSSADIDAYLDVDQPFDCAGSYKIEKAGMALIERLESKDPSAIQGIPMLSLTNSLLKLGIPFNQLWRKS